MAERTKRSPRLIDLIIVVAGSALALMLHRISWETFTLEVGYKATFTLAYKVGVWPAPSLISLSVVLLIVRLVPPRPSRPDFFRQPGNWAALAILSHMLYQVLTMSWHEKLQPYFSRIPYHPNFNTFLFSNRFAGECIFVSWVTLALTGCWQAERSWMDRVGRVVGVLAILQWVVSVLIP
jgi:hypothetical protein